MKANLHKRLLHYAAAVPTILSLQPLGGQIVVHNPEPNIIGGLNTPVSLDFNDDGDSEMNFEISEMHHSGSDSYGGTYHYITRKIIVNPETGALIGDGYPNDIIHYDVEPTMLGYDEIISSDASWYRQDYQILCSLGISDWGNIFAAKGNWLDKNDTAYLGVKLTLNGNLHYGWVRLNVNYDEPSYTILSYAHNAIPGAYIRAGQIDQHTFDLQAMQTGENILISPPEFFIGKPLNLQVHDLSGHTYLNEQIMGEEINYLNMLDKLSGIYIITLFDENISRSIKVVYIRG